MDLKGSKSNNRGGESSRHFVGKTQESEIQFLQAALRSPTGVAISAVV